MIFAIVASALAFAPPASRTLAPRRAHVSMSDDGSDLLGAALFSGGVGQGKEVLKVLDAYEQQEMEAGLQEECFLTPDGEGCCMIEAEPLLDLCNIIGSPSIEPALKQLFDEVLAKNEAKFEESLMGEEGAPCVTATRMRAAIRAKVEPAEVA